MVKQMKNRRSYSGGFPAMPRVFSGRAIRKMVNKTQKEFP